MNKDYLDNIEELDERELPNVNIDKEKIEMIKSNVMGTIKGLQERNKMVDVNITLEEALSIREKLGDNADQTIFGVKSAKLMRDVMIKVIEEKEGIAKEDIVAELFRDAYNIYSRGMANAAMYYKLFLTKKELIIYVFDTEYKVLNNYRTLIENVKVGKAGALNSHMRSDEYFIELPDTKIILYRSSGGSEESFDGFIESLKEAGVTEPSKGKMLIFKIAIIVICILIMAWFIMNI